MQASKALESVEKASQTDEIEVSISEKDKEVRVFTGIVDELQVCHHNGVYAFTLVAVTYTDILDYKRADRSFQNQIRSC